MKEINRVTGLLERQRCRPFSNGGLEHQSNSTSHTRRIIALNDEKETLEQALEVEKAGLKWFREKFFDHQKITIDKEDVSREPQDEKAKREAAGKLLEAEKQLRKIAETLNNEREFVWSDSDSGVEDGVGRVLIKAKEDDLNKRTRSEVFASEPSSSKKRNPNPTLEGVG
ncbi:hypothetical protein EYC80_003529 [Monilinia laxa]|uniref:Uncharacterized protein n=1 Tax=Monilinia laxa TaxID=61186 RepID=A0A5N6KKA7_MONLA|nr:hypothetical protein EYC80_003529 [Monilinia laxa]